MLSEGAYAMSLKKWLGVFFAAALVAAALFAGLNALVDPFGLFGDKLLNWWSYDMTQNPRTAKIGWLDDHHADYDSYIIGCSKTSSFPTELLNRYFGGARFYNMTMYGGDLYDTEMTVRYLLEQYGAKHIVVNSGFAELLLYKGEDDPMKGNLHARVDGTSLPLFYAKYLFANPDYAWAKLKAYRENSYLVNPNQVFNPVTGAYDKSLRDVEPVGSLPDYLEKYPAFTEQGQAHASLPAVDACVASIERMKQMCEVAGATFTFVVSPMYAQDLDLYYNQDLLRFFRELSQKMDFWDFSGYHSVSFEPRYFYDTNHFRNAVGTMMLAKMFGNGESYVPEDFGVLVTRANVEKRLDTYRNTRPEALHNDQQLPILMFHNVSETVSSDYDVTAKQFAAILSAIRDAGYHTVSFSQVVDYVEKGTALPEKPLVITFDDGYEDNLTVAAPILQKFGMCATVNVIGVSVGKTTYKDTGQPITPHFSLEQAAPWVKAGVIEIGSHSYDLHQTPELDGEDCRQGIYRMKGESEGDYIRMFREDFLKSSSGIEAALGRKVATYAYPYGYHTDLSEVLLSEMGVQVTLTVDAGTNVIVKGLPQSLRALKRYTVDAETSAEQVLDYLKGRNSDD